MRLGHKIGKPLRQANPSRLPLAADAHGAATQALNDHNSMAAVTD